MLLCPHGFHTAQGRQYRRWDPQLLQRQQHLRIHPSPTFTDCLLKKWLKKENGVNAISVQKIFSMDHKCAMKGVFLMELEEEDETPALGDDLRISLHALTGITGANTMQLTINIAGKELRALMDSGSTHTFIHDVVVHHLGLEVTLQPGLSVKVANGERLQSYGACKAADVLV
jgi:hypothetical protein